MKHSKFVASLRRAADFFEQRPELGLPHEGIRKEVEFHFYAFFTSTSVPSINSKEGLAFFAKAVGGKLDKIDESNYFKLKSQQDGFSLSAVATRNNVCEKVITGTKHVPAVILEARPETIIPAHEEPIYEWRCPSLLAPTAEPSAEPEADKANDALDEAKADEASLDACEAVTATPIHCHKCSQPFSVHNDDGSCVED